VPKPPSTQSFRLDRVFVVFVSPIFLPTKFILFSRFFDDDRDIAVFHHAERLWQQTHLANAPLSVLAKNAGRESKLH
jgi:hypothetical protein